MTYACRTGFQPAALWQIVNELNRSFSDGAAKETARPSDWAPAVDILETPGAFTLEVDLPGLKREDFELEVIANTLTIKGERKSEPAPESGQYRQSERRYGAFERTFRFAEKIDAAKVEAKFENGVLRVLLPKPEQVQPRKVEVSVN
ncbi:MAG: Hsp20/alpha crystallin family protein [Candidatus Hydrogenedentes bacterium]|nr:Hsp20/alpha crystallin family protein [Candidatus Hydrogenedentota bacterium]